MRISDLLREEKGKKIYESKRESLIKNYPGKYVAINVDTGDLYIGNTSEEAMEKAKSQHPEHNPFVTKIGSI